MEPKNKSPYEILMEQKIPCVIDRDGFDRIAVFSNGARFHLMDAAHAVQGHPMQPRMLPGLTASQMRAYNFSASKPSIQMKQGELNNAEIDQPAWSVGQPNESLGFVPIYDKKGKVVCQVFKPNQLYLAGRKSEEIRGTNARCISNAKNIRSALEELYAHCQNPSDKTRTTALEKAAIALNIVFPESSENSAYKPLAWQSTEIVENGANSVHDNHSNEVCQIPLQGDGCDGREKRDEITALVANTPGMIHALKNLRFCVLHGNGGPGWEKAKEEADYALRMTSKELQSAWLNRNHQEIQDMFGTAGISDTTPSWEKTKTLLDGIGELQKNTAPNKVAPSI